MNIKDLRAYVVRSAAKPVKIGSMAGHDVMISVKDQPYEPYDGYRFLLREDGPVLLVEKFRNGKLINRIEWKDIQLNSAMSDADFEL